MMSQKKHNAVIGQVYCWTEPSAMYTRRNACIVDVSINPKFVPACEIYLFTIRKANVLYGVLLYSSFKQIDSFGSILGMCHIDGFSSDYGWEPYVFES